MTEFIPSSSYTYDTFSEFYQAVQLQGIRGAYGPEWPERPIAGIVDLGGEAVRRFVILGSQVHSLKTSARGLSNRRPMGTEYSISWLSFDLDQPEPTTSHAAVTEMRYRLGAAEPFMLAGEQADIDPPVDPFRTDIISWADRNVPLAKVESFLWWRRKKQERELFGKAVQDFLRLTGAAGPDEPAL